MCDHAALIETLAGDPFNWGGWAGKVLENTQRVEVEKRWSLTLTHVIDCQIAHAKQGNVTLTTLLFWVKVKLSPGLWARPVLVCLINKIYSMRLRLRL